VIIQRFKQTYKAYRDYLIVLEIYVKAVILDNEILLIIGKIKKQLCRFITIYFGRTI